MKLTSARNEVSEKCGRVRYDLRLKLTQAIVVFVIITLITASGFAQSSRLKPASIRNSDTQRQTQLRNVSKNIGSTNRSFTVEKTGAVVYRSEEEFQLKCDFYVPKTGNEVDREAGMTFPAIIAIHGGAWSSGSKVTMLRHASVFARAGYVVMAINYRHAPKYQHPAQIHDCKFAVRWLKANSSTWQVDPTRIGVFGYSAGGHLAALIGTTDVDDGLDGEIPVELEKHDSRVACVAAGGAPCEFSWISETSNVLKPWLGETRGKAPARYESASPLNYVDADDAPFYFFHGQYDLIVPIDSSLKLHNALGDAGVSSNHDLALLTGHVATFSNMIWAEKSLRFFNRHLRKRNVPKK